MKASIMSHGVHPLKGRLDATNNELRVAKNTLKDQRYSGSTELVVATKTWTRSGSRHYVRNTFQNIM